MYESCRLLFHLTMYHFFAADFAGIFDANVEMIESSPKAASSAVAPRSTLSLCAMLSMTYDWRSTTESSFSRASCSAGDRSADRGLVVVAVAVAAGVDDEDEVALCPASDARSAK